MPGFSKSSHGLSMNGGTLKATCKNAAGHDHHSELNLDSHIGNINGKFDVGKNFSNSARNIRLEGAILRCGLKDAEGNWHPAKLDLDAIIDNHNGHLKFDDLSKAMAGLNLGSLNTGDKVRFRSPHTDKNLVIKDNGDVAAGGGNGPFATFSVEKHGEHYKFKNQKGKYLAIKGDAVTHGPGGPACLMQLVEKNGHVCIRHAKHDAGIAVKEDGTFKDATKVKMGPPAQFELERC
eukprot:m.17235 g.17235  ORF g.17235 m.17235 type:complete len:235 (+) comp5953_c0_seq2:153-857(+)